MKLKYRMWRLTAPKGSPSQEYSTLPIGMVAAEGAFMKRDALYNALKHAEEGGKRIDQQWDFIYVKRPGFLNGVMNPNMERWESFGTGWGKFRRLPEDPSLDPQDWVTILSLDDHAGVEVLTASLEDWIAAKNSTAWYDLRRRKQNEARMKRS